MTRHKKYKNKQAGFTLIELLVGISVIALLSSIVLVTARQSRMDARDTQRIANLKQMKTALELYYADHDVYPTSRTDTYGATNFSIFSSWDELHTELSPYMASLPHDPLEPTSYFYYFSGPQMTWCLPANGQFLKISNDGGYTLVAFLEDPTHVAMQTDGGIYPDRYEVLGGNAYLQPTCP